MTIYFVRYPDDEQKREDLNLLLNGLEKWFEEFSTFNAVGIVTEDARLDPILANLAMVVMATEGASAGTKEEAVLEDRQVHGENGGGDRAICPECEKEFLKPREDSRYCSSKCYQKEYNRRTWRERSKKKRDDRAGDGIVNGKLNLRG